MAELNRQNNRIKFLPGKQRTFIESAEKHFSVRQLAKLCGKSERTIRDWRREVYLIDDNSLKTLCDRLNMPIPKNIKILDKYWYVHKGKKLGWEAVVKKYGAIPKNEKYRKQKWYEWWEREGKFKTNGLTRAPLKIKKPRYSKNIAEFVGIMIGDGSITNSQIQISMSSIVDKEYIPYIKKLIEDQFRVYVSIIRPSYANVIKIIVSRKELVFYCQKIGLRKGNKLKEGLSVPEWIFKNKEYQKACLRGVMDTDGCIFNERHIYKNRKYSYKRWNITSASLRLCKDIYKMLENLGFNPRIRNSRCVQLENKNEIERYFEIVGTRNPKHLRRYLL